MAVLIGTTHVLLAVSPSMLITHASKPGLPELALYFVKVGAFTFGGGITVLAFMQDQVVNQFHWLTAQEFLDGLALGQLTPGPVLMLAAYVGYKAGGVWGGVVGALAVFLPAFVVMLSILPALARFKRVAWLKSAMSGATAAVLGVLAVSLLRLVPHAAPDAITSALLVLTIAAIMMWRLAPLSLIAGGALAGIAVRMKSLQRLKDLA
jgi:chromate transporter